MKRRSFLQTLGTTATAAVVMQGCDSDRKAIDPKKSHDMALKKKTSHRSALKETTLKLATSWPAHFPIMGEAVERLAYRVEMMSAGALKIKIYPKNTLIPALAVFDAASRGDIDCFHSGPYYWKGKNSAFSLFSGTPFGMTAEQINAWLMYGGGYEIWRELYANYNLYPFAGGNTNVQMGGWFRKKIDSLSDLQGIKMRIPGLGGEVFTRLGVNAVLLPAGEIYTALERGVIDATEWVGPALDQRMGFYKVAPYYYKGWHEPGSILELTFNKHRWESLSVEHQAILEHAIALMNSEMSTEFFAKNAQALIELQQKGVQLYDFPSDVIEAGKKQTQIVLETFAQQSDDFNRVWRSAEAFMKLSEPYLQSTLGAYLAMKS